MSDHALPTHASAHLKFNDFVIWHLTQQANTRTTPSNTADTCGKTQHTAEHSDGALPSPPNHCPDDFNQRKQNK
jgi:hypothetical protein